MIDARANRSVHNRLFTRDADFFVEGTPIATSTGYRPIEELASGNMICLADGDAWPLTWVGIAPTYAPVYGDPWDASPARVRTHAFDDRVPETEILQSPGHNAIVEGALIPICLLIDGTRIAQEQSHYIEYYHLEWEERGVALAANLPWRRATHLCCGVHLQN